MGILQWVFVLAIFCPFLVFGISAWFFKHPDQSITFRTAMDITTPFFIVAVILGLHSVFELPGMVITTGLCLLLAIFMFYVERKIQKRIKIIPFLQRIWRAYFLVFCVIYCCIWIFGIVIYGFRQVF